MTPLQSSRAARRGTGGATADRLARDFSAAAIAAPINDEQ